MKYISELKEILGQHLNWHKSRLDCFSQMLLALFVVRSVNLSEIATAMQGSSKIESRYKRLKRFFSHFEFDSTPVSCWLYRLFFPKDKPVYIAIDRTNWYFGRSKINVFMLSVCYEGHAVPIFWTLLNKAGNSKSSEQIELISRFIDTFGKAQIQGILADREFPNKELIGWLTREKIPFYMRIKGNMDVCIRKKKYKSAYELFAHLTPYQQEIFGMRVNLFGQPVYLAGSKNSRDELMIVITNHNPKNAIACYLRRWEVETLFSALKSRGWRFEETHLTEHKKIDKLITLLAIGFAWAHKVGEWKAELKPIPLKKLRNQRRPQNSYFRLGLDIIRDLLTQFKTDTKLFLKYLNCIMGEQKYPVF